MKVIGGNKDSYISWRLRELSLLKREILKSGKVTTYKLSKEELKKY